MSSKIESHKKLKTDHQKCKEWANLIGSPYSGGGGGIGKVFSVDLCTGDNAPTIYHQAYSGATNYHRMPIEFKKYLEQAIHENMRTLIERAFYLQIFDLSKSAIEAKKEYETINEDLNVVA